MIDTPTEDIETRLNEYLTEHPEGIKDSKGWSDFNRFNHTSVVGFSKSESVLQRLSMSDPKSVNVITLSQEALQVLGLGSPEFLVFQQIPEGDSIEKNANLSEVGLSWAVKNGWIKIEKSKTDKDAKPKIRRVGVDVQDKWKQVLESFHKGEKIDDNSMKTLKSRKWVISSTVRTFEITKGPKFGLNVKLESTITLEQVKSGQWKDIQLKGLNLNCLGAVPKCGHLHPLLKVREGFRQIFLELGYEEMKTDNFVESSFWNFDTLFQPQQHPARDAHDTFFISNPEHTIQPFPSELYDRVKTVHEVGGYGSIGWRYKFSDQEPKRNLLRTHTTAASSRTLYQLAQQPVFTPKKYFSIDRVFRNETLDTTHLAEFHQIEGMIIDYNISLSNLMGAIKQFYERIGIKKIKFKPAYNPYTEPSMEIFGYSDEKHSWMEIGNSGIFRPEMLLPLGLPPDVGIAAWGLGLERPTMIMYRLKNIKELVGHKVDLEMVKKNQICQF